MCALSNSVAISTQIQLLFCLLLKLDHENSAQNVSTECGCNMYGSHSLAWSNFLKPLRFLVIKISVSVYIFGF